MGTAINYRLVTHNYRLYRVLMYRDRESTVEIATLEAADCPPKWTQVTSQRVIHEVMEESYKEV